jgi:hypothetical protein
MATVRTLTSPRLSNVAMELRDPGRSASHLNAGGAARVLKSQRMPEMHVGWCHFALGCWITFVQCYPGLAQSGAPVKEATPLEPVAAVLNAFRAHRLVALDEGNHNNLQGYAFRMALIHHPEFAALVNHIVVEAGNSLYQDVMDKFLAGEDVPYDALRRIWQDTTQPHAVWDKPIYEEFYRAVRALNSGLPREHRLRVLLGDPPVDWAAAHPSLNRPDSFTAELIRREVLSKGRRALIIYGGMHLLRHNFDRNYEPSDGIHDGIVEVLERDAPGSVFSIWTNTLTDLQAAQPSVSSWPNPSLTILRSTLLGAQDFTVYFPERGYKFDKNGVRVEIKATRPLRMEDQFDAVLYIGPKSSITSSRFSPEQCRDQAYIRMRAARMELFGMSADAFKKQCEGVLAHGWN